EERVVPTHADVDAGVDGGAALAHDDGARAHSLPVRALDAQHLGLAVTPVARGAYAFLMCHNFVLSAVRGRFYPRAPIPDPQLYADVRYREPGEALAVAGLAAVPLLGLVLEHDQLAAIVLADHPG